MQPIYLLRVFSGLALRLGLSGAFLLGSAGLAVAASLLLYTAADGVGERSAWKTAADTSTTSFGLSQGTRPTVLLAPPTSLGPAAPLRYSLTDNLLYHGPTTDQAMHPFLVARAAPGSPYPTPLGMAKSTMQRSWDTIKSAFR
ncbi:MAG: hypothetical protein ACRYG7_51180 [Janthinobacterium lividum]